MGRLDGKVALISGGARGQGAAEARLFVAEGAKVVVGDVLDEGKRVADELGDDALFVHLDVTREEDWSASVDATTNAFGRLDILINNAGVAQISPLAMTSLEDYLAVVRVNQVGVFLGMRAAIPPMVQARGGSIINTSSILGLLGMIASVAYTSSKFAVRGMTKVAALELASLGIRVNSIHPGFIDTAMLHPEGMGDDYLESLRSRVPQGRVGRADEIAQLAVFLASDESSYCTGAEFVIDGGVVAGLPLPTST